MKGGNGNELQHLQAFSLFDLSSSSEKRKKRKRRGKEGSRSGMLSTATRIDLTSLLGALKKGGKEREKNYHGERETSCNKCPLRCSLLNWEGGGRKRGEKDAGNMEAIDSLTLLLPPHHGEKRKGGEKKRWKVAERPPGGLLSIPSYSFIALN